MPIQPATPEHLPAIQSLLARAATRFVQFGQEDLPDLLQGSICQIGVTDDRRERLWGFAAIQLEPRPATLPVSAPNRAYLRGIVLAVRRSPTVDTAALVTAGMKRLRALGQPTTVIAQGQERWLNPALTPFGFTEIDQVRYYQYTASADPAAPSPAQLVGVTPQDLFRLAQLDAETFPPVWHMGEGELAGLLFTSHMRMAWDGDRPVGYAALRLGGGYEAGRRSAFLNRLAVHPSAQGRGIGRQLLADAIAHAHSQQHSSIFLNTQVSNKQSQRLYEGMGFRPSGQVYKVFTAQVP